MKVLVTGGAGFIGSHVVNKLIRQGCRVTVADNLSTGSVNNLNQAAAFVQMDIRNPEILQLFESERFDAIVHLAAQTMVPKSLENPVYDSDVNIAGTLQILEAARKTGVKRVVFSSTAAVYGNTAAVTVREETALQPASFYGLSKWAVERYLALYQELYGLEYVVLRYANVYGERQGDFGEGGVISIFVRNICGGRPVTIFGDGGQTRDFVYAGDVAAANWLALGTTAKNSIYNIGTQTESSVNLLVEELAVISGKTVEKQYKSVREGDIYRSSLCNEKAVENLHWSPQTLLRDGLARTYASLTGVEHGCAT